MPPHPMSGPDPSKPASAATGVLRAQPDDASFENDFAELAARFAAKSGGGLSPELSADLALEIVLKEIVEQACLATGATGAAIVLQRDGEMVCRASSGTTAPELGARLDTATGLSGECIKTRRTLRSDDVEDDPRADLEASRRLGVRSVMVLPLLRGTELAGVFEVFSSRPSAFGERDERTLEALAHRALSNLERAAEPLSPPQQVTPVPDRFAELPNENERSDVAPRRWGDLLTWALGFAVVACALLLGVLVGRHLGWQKASVRVHRAAPALPPGKESPAATATAPAPKELSAEAKDTKPTVRPAGSNQPHADDSVPPGSLLVYENGKEVFRMPAVQGQSTQNKATQNQAEPASAAASRSEEQGSAMQPAASVEPEQVVELSPAVAENSLLRRIEPEYPEAARQQQIQGPVVLDVHISQECAVQDVNVVSGPPLLAQASTEAVRQWRFKPHLVGGRPVEMQTRVTLNFRLPK